MKIEAGQVIPIDEELILESRIAGVMPTSKCQLQDRSEYWYEITGKQTLADVCGIRQLSCELLEQLVIQLANAIVRVEDYLIDTNCILLDPEYIFLNDRQFGFILYPFYEEELSDSFRRLMEYLLTRIDHSSRDLVQRGYGIYEKTLIPGFSITEIRDCILSERSEAKKELRKEDGNSRKSLQTENTRSENSEIKPAGAGGSRSERIKPERARPERIKPEKQGDEEAEDGESGGEINMVDLLYADVEEETLFEKISGWFRRAFHRKGTNEGTEAVFPRESREEDFIIKPGQICLPEPEVHPTICLTDHRMHPDGLLLYEGMDGLENIHLQEGQISIGKGEAVDVKIKRETVSHLHARINGKDQEYYIEDLNSTNGTFINGEALSYREKRQLKTNDIVRFADVKYRFV